MQQQEQEQEQRQQQQLLEQQPLLSVFRIRDRSVIRLPRVRLQRIPLQQLQQLQQQQQLLERQQQQQQQEEPSQDEPLRKRRRKVVTPSDRVLRKRRGEFLTFDFCSQRLLRYFHPQTFCSINSLELVFNVHLTCTSNKFTLFHLKF